MFQRPNTEKAQHQASLHIDTGLANKAASPLPFKTILLVVASFVLSYFYYYSNRPVHVNHPKTFVPDFSHLGSHCSHLRPIPATEHHKRQVKLAETLISLGASAFVAEPGASALYYANISSSSWHVSERPLLLVVTPTVNEIGIQPKLTVLTPKFEASRAKNSLVIPVQSGLVVNFVEWAEEENPYEVLLQALGSVPRAGHVIVDEAARYFVVDGLQKAGVPVTGVASEISQIRERKTEIELAVLRCANEVTLEAIREVRKHMYFGMRESEAFRWITKALGEAGLNNPWGLVLFGGVYPQENRVLDDGYPLRPLLFLFLENAALPHGSGTDRVLGQHDLILFDVGGSLHGYSSDVTRTFALPHSAISAKHLEIWFTVHKAQHAAIEAVSVGVTAARVDAVARSVIRDAGYGAYFTHRLGHGIGLEMHEKPFLRGGNDVVLLAGNTCSDEPGIYIEGEVGVRLEDCFVVGPDGDGVFLTGGPARSPWLP